jgi:hypothetical protein
MRLDRRSSRRTSTLERIIMHNHEGDFAPKGECPRCDEFYRPKFTIYLDDEAYDALIKTLDDDEDRIEENIRRGEEEVAAGEFHTLDELTKEKNESD